MKDTCIINVGVDYWYDKGTHRLIQSLKDNGFEGDILCETEYPENSPIHFDNPYAFKVYQFERALAKGYKKIFWMDCSIISSPNPNIILEILNTKGYYFVKNGYSIGQETNDYTLDWFGITRDEAMELPQVCSGFFGLNFNKVRCRNIFRKWKRACEAGCFKGNRIHDDKDSKDKRFLHHRQDQSSLSLALNAYKEGLHIDNLDDLLTYNPDNKNLFLCRGM